MARTPRSTSAFPPVPPIPPVPLPAVPPAPPVFPPAPLPARPQPAPAPQVPTVPPAPSRLDVALVGRGLAPSREKAKGAIAAGLVFVNGRPASKPSAPVGPHDKIEVRGVALPYVSRGGLKLEKALAVFGLDVAGARCVDLGASTGGFTDCLLQHGAAHVVAVDVGHDQLAEGLRRDARVTCLEGTDARRVTADQVGGPFDVAVTDVSFISLAKVLPAMAGLLRAGGQAVCLIKPQFEAGRAHVGKRGVVRDPRVHHAVVERVLGEAYACGLEPTGLDFSPITGPEGNIEYLLHAVRRAEPCGPAAMGAGGKGGPERLNGLAQLAAGELAERRGCHAGEAGHGRAVEDAARLEATEAALFLPLDVAVVVHAAHAALGR